MALLLGVNIDHVATLRQARYSGNPHSENAEPSPLDAGFEAQAGGADSLTIHVRGDRRHMQSEDAFSIRRTIPLPLNLEMGVTAEMLRLALELKPDFVCLVPETREEVTTEGGLSVADQFSKIADVTKRLQDEGILVSLFINPDEREVEAAIRCGATMVELHTGAFANANRAVRGKEVQRLATAARLAHTGNLQVNAGHGINYQNITELWAVPHLAELNIGHSIIAHALKAGLRSAVREMKDQMQSYTSACGAG